MQASPHSSTDRADRLSAPHDRVSQGQFDFLVPASLVGRNSLTAREVAAIIGYKRAFVEQEAERGKLEFFGPKDREVCRRRYTLRGVLLWVAERMDTMPDEHFRRVRDLVAKLTPSQRAEMVAWLTKKNR
jgi:hypothetical protein